MAEAKKDMDIEDDEEFETARREGKVVKCILVMCSSSKLIFVHVVPCKGVDEDGHVVKLVCDNLAWMGHTRIILKCDNEPAVKKVITEALIRMKVDVKDLETISQEFPERYESQSNGMPEVGVKIFRGQFRTPEELHATTPWCGDPRRPPSDGLAREPHMPFDQRHGSRRRRSHRMGPSSRPSIQAETDRIR
jgi:hypothetical protein